MLLRVAKQKSTQRSRREVERLARIVAKEYDYAAFCRKRAMLVPTGTALVVLGIALSFFGSLLPALPQSDAKVLGAGMDWLIKFLSKEVIETDYAEKHVGAALLLLTCIVAGLLILRHARTMLHEFQAAHPYINHGLPQDQADVLNTRGRRFQWAGGTIIAISAVAYIIGRLCGIPFSGSTSASVLSGCVLTLACPGIWFALHGEWVRAATGIFAYNCSATNRRSVYEIDVNEQEPLRSLLLAEKYEFLRCSLHGNTVFACCAVLSAAMFFLPTLESPAWWVPLAIGVIIRYLYGRHGVKNAERLFYKVAQEDAKLSIGKTASKSAN